MSTSLDIVRIPVLNDNYVWLMREPQSGAVGVVDPAVVIVEARRQHDVPNIAPVPIEPTLAMFDRPAPTLVRYDELLETR
jgi:hypothetical protein